MNKIKNFFSRLGKTSSYFLKGIAVGIAMIIPGVSGGTLAVILKIYDDLINAVNQLFKHFKESMKVILPVLLGAVVGFIALVFPLKWGLKHCPLIVVTLFVGFIVGSLPSLYKKVYKKETPISIMWGIIFLALMIGVCFLPSSNVSTISLDVGTWFYLVLVGFIISSALVAPGVSGSMLLMVLGFYESILNIVSEVIKFQNLGHNILILIPLAIGIVLGFFVVSFVMGKLLKHYPVPTYFAIIGLIVGSIACIYTKTFSEYEVVLDALQISLSVISFIIGGTISFLIGRKDKEKEEIVSEENTDGQSSQHLD
ncbi:MAG: DUF368 domain-containing protein [Bacilli bacterium]